MRTIEQVKSEIREMQDELRNLKGRKTEVYSRIVGYYRSLDNWNRGKREEYGLRRHFEQSVPEETSRGSVKPAAGTETRDRPLGAAAASYLLFHRESCPNCPPVKELIALSGIPGRWVDADTAEGTDLAVRHEIYAAPTVLFLDSDGSELARAVSAAELEGMLESRRTTAVTA